MRSIEAKSCLRHGTVIVITLILILISNCHASAIQVDEAAISQLVRDLELGNERVQKAIGELTRIGKPAVPKLLEALKQESSEVRSAAIVTLAGIGPVDPSVSQALIEALDRVSAEPLESSPFDHEVFVLSVALYAMGPEVRPRVIAALDHKRPNARTTAAMTLSCFAQDTEDLELNSGALIAHSEPIPLENATIRKLIALTDDDSGSVRYASLVSLAAVPPDAPLSTAILPVLVKRVDDDDEIVRGAATVAITAYGERAVDALPALMKRFRDFDGSYIVHQNTFGDAIGAMGATAAPAVPMLVEAAKSPKTWMREGAIYTLGRIGSKVEGVMPALRNALNDPADTVRREAENALKPSLEPKLARLLEKLNSRNPNVARNALNDLRGRGAEGAEILIPHLGNSKESLEQEVFSLLRQIGEPAIPRVVKALEHENPDVRRGAADVLGSFGKPAANAADRLALLHRTDPIPEVRFHAALALASTRPGDELGLTALVKAKTPQKIDDDQSFWTKEIINRVGLALGRWQTPEAVGALIEAQRRITSSKSRASSDPDDSLARPLIEAGPIAIPALIEALESEGNTPVLASALAGLGEAALPGLSDALKSDITLRRAGAAKSLKILAESHRQEARPAIPSLIAALEDDDARVRREVAQALGAFGPEAEAGKAGLVRLLKDPNRDVSEAASYALVAMPPVAETMLLTLLQWISSRDQHTRDHARQVIQRLGDDAIPPLLTLLRSEDPIKRRGAAKAINSLDFDVVRRNAQTLAAPLVATLSRDDSTAKSALGVLECFGGVGGQAAQKLTALVDHESAQMRRAVVKLLRHEGEVAVPALLRAAGDPDLEVRALAAMSLGGDVFHPRPLSPKSLAGLLEAYKAPEASVRAAAIGALGIANTDGSLGLLGRLSLLAGFNPRPSETEIEVAKQLGMALDDTDVSVRTAAAKGLSRIRPTVPGAVDSLMRSLGDKAQLVRNQAAQGLSGMESPDIPRLATLLSEDREEFRMGAAEALARMYDKDFRPAYEALLVTLEDPSAGVREAAAHAVSRIVSFDEIEFEPFSTRCREALRNSWKRNTPKARRTTLEILQKLGPDDTTLSVLIAALKDEDTSVRQDAVGILEKLGPRAIQALPALREACDDKDESIRSVARRAIKSIEN